MLSIILLINITRKLNTVITAQVQMIKKGKWRVIIDLQCLFSVHAVNLYQLSPQYPHDQSGDICLAATKYNEQTGIQTGKMLIGSSHFSSCRLVSISIWNCNDYFFVSIV